MTFNLQSSAFKDNDVMPQKYTCDGQDISPPLSWKNPPANTKTFALVLADPDAPTGTWYHWLVYNIPAHTDEFIEHIRNSPKDTKIGKNSWGTLGYRGPCPPSGTLHRYIFTLYALDSILNLPAEVDFQKFYEIAKKHVISEAEIKVRYQRDI